MAPQTSGEQQTAGGGYADVGRNLRRAGAVVAAAAVLLAGACSSGKKDGGTPSPTESDRVGAAIGRNPTARAALARFLGVNSIIVTDQPTAAGSGEAKAIITAPGCETDITIDLDNPSANMSVRAIEQSLAEGSLSASNWVRKELKPGVVAYYQIVESPMFFIPGGSTTNPADKFNISGEFPSHLINLPPQQRADALSDLTSALFQAGALS